MARATRDRSELVGLIRAALPRMIAWALGLASGASVISGVVILYLDSTGSLGSSGCLLAGPPICFGGFLGGLALLQISDDGQRRLPLILGWCLVGVSMVPVVLVFLLAMFPQLVLE